MRYPSLIATILTLAMPAFAQEKPASIENAPVPPPVVTPDRNPRPRSPEFDFSRSVTLTGDELKALVNAAVLRAQSDAANAAAASVNAKVEAALTVPKTNGDAARD